MQVTLGFGLHCGWAIEGAIGSEYKIDASYLLFGCTDLHCALEVGHIWMQRDMVCMILYDNLERVNALSL